MERSDIPVFIGRGNENQPVTPKITSINFAFLLTKIKWRFTTFFSHSIFLAVVMRPRQPPRQGRMPSDNSLLISYLTLWFFTGHSLRRCCWRGRTTMAGAD